MKVKFADIWLAGVPEDPWKSRASGLTLDGARLTEDSPNIRAAVIEVFDRMNYRSSISFSVHRYHATEAAGFLFNLDHPGSLPGKGILLFDINGITRTLPIAVLDRVTCAPPRGRTTLHTYNLHGGKIQ